MKKIIDILDSEYSSEYYLKKYKNPKIYPKAVTAKPLSSFSEKEKKEIMEKHKRWYVYYSFLNPDTNKMERQSPIFYGVNRKFSDFDSRLDFIKEIRNSVENILKSGFSPYVNDKEVQSYTTSSSLDFALKIKEKEVEATTYNGYETRITAFKKFIEKQDSKYHAIGNVDKKIVTKFLNTIKTPKTRNNTKGSLSSIFNVLADEDFITTNFIKDIRNKKLKEKPIKIYSEKDVDEIVKLLEINDYTLLMFIYFVSYMFWRPIEIVRIKVSDIDFNKKIIVTKTKTKESKIKIIPDLLLDDLKKFAKGKTGFLFKPDNFIEWNLEETAKRTYFTRRFSRFRTKHKISSEFKLYSFRHTYITKIYLELRKSKTKEETIKILSLITGHESKAIHTYIRVNDVELPEDYSKLLK